MNPNVNLSAYIRSATESAANALMDAEASSVVNAAHYERSGTRTAYRNGYRTRRWHTEAGTVILHIPKLRSGTYYPAFLEQEAISEEQFAALALKALIRPITDEDVRSLLTDADDQTILDHIVFAFNDVATRYLSRKLRYPYQTLIFEADQDCVMVYGERATGTRHLLDVVEADSSRAYWIAWARRMSQRGLQGVEAITGGSDDIREAVRAAFPGADTPQVHLSRDVVAALGMPLERPVIDRRKPHAMLSHTFDSTLRIVIDGKTLTHLRRLMRDERDAVGEPLKRVA